MNKYTERVTHSNYQRHRATIPTQSGNLQYPSFSPLYICSGVSAPAQI